MNKRVISLIIFAIIGVAILWILLYNPSNNKIDIPHEHTSTSNANVNVMMEIAAQIHCPDTCCVGKEVNTDKSDCATARDIRETILMMLDRGLDKKGVMTHLSMMGLDASETGMHKGHPSMSGSQNQDSNGSNGNPKLPEGHPPMPKNHPPITN